MVSLGIAYDKIRLEEGRPSKITESRKAKIDLGRLAPAELRAFMAMMEKVQ